jgi:hypothetical protein
MKHGFKKRTPSVLCVRLTAVVTLNFWHSCGPMPDLIRVDLCKSVANPLLFSLEVFADNKGTI